MKTNSLSLALASVVACSVITLGASSASAATMNHLTAALDFISNANVNETDIANGCSINWTTYEGHTKGACFFIEVLKHGNTYAADYTGEDIRAMWGHSGPTSAQLYAEILASPAVGGTAPSPETYFRKISSATSIQPGDVIVINSVGTTYAGHTMIVRQPAILMTTQLNPKWSGTLQWAVPVADSTDSKHGCNTSYPDSRWYGDCTSGYSTGTGAGTGYIRIYTDILTGKLLGYTWSPTSADSSTYYSPSTRPYLIGRLTNLPAPIPPPPPPPDFGTPS